MIFTKNVVCNLLELDLALLNSYCDDSIEIQILLDFDQLTITVSIIINITKF